MPTDKAHPDTPSESNQPVDSGSVLDSPSPIVEAAGPNTITEACEALGKLFRESGVQRVIWIDDDFAVDHANNPPTDFFPVVESADLKNLPGLSGILLDLPGDIRTQQIAAAWPTLSKEVRRTLYDKLLQLASSRGVDLPLWKRVADRLLALEGCKLDTWTLDEWRSRQAQLLATRFDDQFTVLLIDQDYFKEGGGHQEGIAILRSLEAAPNTAEKSRCALLTHTRLIGEEHSSSAEFATKEGLTSSRFLLISKERLADDQFTGFVMMLRLTLLNPRCEVFRVQAEKVYQTALEEAKKQVAKITIYDTEQIVFASSRKEGVWEPDTLFRILGMYFRREARKLAAASPELRQLADEIRKIAGPAALDPAPKQEGTKALEIRQLELYEESDYLNKHHTPIDLGDVFEVVRKDGDGTDLRKSYILVAQPCEVMVRYETTPGQRKPSMIEATLVEVVPATAEIMERLRAGTMEKGTYYRLDYFEQSGDHAYAIYGKARAINLCVLDLCVLQPDGRAELTADDSPAVGLIPSWQLRHKFLCEAVRQCGKQWKALTGSIKRATLDQPAVKITLQEGSVRRSFSPNPGVPFDLIVDADEKKTQIKFSCRRIRRLNQPWAGALLTEYAQYLSRAAFEHDYGKIRSED